MSDYEHETELTSNFSLTLFNIQKELDKLNRREAEELSKIHAQFESIRQTIYLKRNEAIKRCNNKFWLTVVCYYIKIQRYCV